MSSIFLFIHWNSSCQSTQFIIVLFGCFRYGSYTLIVRLSWHSAYWTMDIRFKIMTNIVKRFLINNWMCLFIEHGDLMDVSNQNVLNQKQFKKVYISDVCCCKKKKNNLMVIMLMRRMLLQNVRALIRRVHNVLFGLWFRLLSSNCSINFLFKIFFQISFRYYSQAHYQIEWLFVSSLVHFTCNGINMVCFQYRQTADEYLAHSKYERAYLTWKCTFIYVRMEFGWHARKCFDVAISLTLFFLSHSIYCVERPISIDRKKTVKFGPFFSLFIALCVQTSLK